MSMGKELLIFSPETYTTVVGARSPHSMMDSSVATYGEENRLWTGDEARAFARVAAVPSLLAARAANGVPEQPHHEGTKNTKKSKQVKHRS